MLSPWGALFRRLDHIQNALDRIELRLVIQQRNMRKNQGVIMSALDTLEDTVAADTDVVSSAVTLLDTIHQELADAIASGDETRVQAVADHIAANTEALAGAVARNTDAAGPTPEPTPEPV